MKDKLEQLLDKAHTLGIKLPYIRDPVKGTPSVSLTMLFISFHLYVFALINKLTGWLAVDLDGTFQLTVLCAGLYFGRSFGNGKAKLDKE